MSLISTAGYQARKLRKHSHRFAAPKALRARLSDIPLPVVALLLTIFLPPEFDFFFGPMRLNWQRVVLIICLPIAVSRLCSGRQLKLYSFDFLLVGAFAWYAFSIFIKEPFETALQSGGGIFLDAAGGYAIARAHIINARQFIATTKLLFILVLIAGALAIPESLFHEHFARNIVAALTGKPPITWIDTRLGLTRAMAVFDHPILLGAYSAAVFALLWFTEPHLLKRLFCCSLIAIAAFFALSSAPLLGLILILTGAVWERFTRQIPGRAWLTIAGIASLYLIASLFSNRSPLKVLATSLVFDSNNAWYRVWIWEFGIANVMNSPIIGVPLGFWERPSWMAADTVDNYWLVIALWGGLPALVCLVASIIMAMRAVFCHMETPQDPELRRCRYAWCATVLGLCFIGATVHFWGTMGVLFTFYIGFGAWLAHIGDGDHQAVGGQAGPISTTRRHRRSTLRRQVASAIGAQAGSECGPTGSGRSTIT
ncbi:MAG TPA: hypothetical protein VH913_25580 [Hyphomicrobiaceae bacterium]|jgi:hypothetical protein